MLHKVNFRSITSQYTMSTCMYIYISLSHKVRDNGSADLHLLDQKIQELVYSMNQHTEMIEQLNGDLQQQKEVRRWVNGTSQLLSTSPPTFPVVEVL